MARLSFQYLATCNNQSLPNKIKMCPNRLKCWQMLSRHSKNWPKTFKILPKWQNFAKSGHTATNEVFFCIQHKQASGRFIVHPVRHLSLLDCLRRGYGHPDHRQVVGTGRERSLKFVLTKSEFIRIL